MNPIEDLKKHIEFSERIVVFTGAGISTESGIQDYRSKGGLWDKFQPVTIQEFLASEEKREEYWNYKLHFMKEVLKAKPNDAHKAIAALEKKGKLRGLITQNIDGLHQAAGVSDDLILEIHGTNCETICLDCGELRPWKEVHERLESGEKVPLCKSCGGLLKPNTISFGQALVPEVLATAQAWAQDCDLMLAVGSTLVVEPAASLPVMAKSAGAKLVIITLSSTPIDSFADLKISDSAGKVLFEAMS